MGQDPLQLIRLTSSTTEHARNRDRCDQESQTHAAETNALDARIVLNWSGRSVRRSVIQSALAGMAPPARSGGRCP